MGRGKERKKWPCFARAEFVVKKRPHILYKMVSRKFFILEEEFLTTLKKWHRSKANGRENAVFDHRVSVIHGLLDGKTKLCFSCRWPLADEDFQSPLFEEGVSCPRCASKLTAARKESLRERQKQMALARKRRTKHIGKEMPRQSPGPGPSCT